MTSSTSSPLTDLWAEGSCHDDVVLQNVLQAGVDHQIFANKNDEGVLKSIKGLLNEPKKREKGLLLFSQFFQSSGDHADQDALLSTFRLVTSHCEGLLGSSVMRGLLIAFLPAARAHYPDIVKELLASKSGFIPKILGHVLRELEKKKTSRPTPDLFDLLEVVILNFKGVSGAFRERLEAALVAHVDEEGGGGVLKALPMLAHCGGRKEWTDVFRKLLEEARRTLHLLYCDFVEDLEEVPSSRLNLPEIAEPNVLLKMSLLKRRLLNLLEALSAYLRRSFSSSPKPVPLVSLMQLINSLLSLNPLELLKKGERPRKEAVFLSGILSPIHAGAWDLLESLILCFGTNLFPEAVTVEQLFSQEMRWMEGASPSSFVGLRTCVYRTLLTWLETTKGFITSPKTAAAWAGFALRDVLIEKGTVGLASLLPMTKKNNNKRKGPVAQIQIQGSSSSSFIPKPATCCEKGLLVLTKLAWGLEPGGHKGVVSALVSTHVGLYGQTAFLSQYQPPSSRKALNQAILDLSIASSGVVSLSLILSLLKRAGREDPSRSVREFCGESISVLERVLHPATQSLLFAPSQSQRHQIQEDEPETIEDEEEEQPEVERVDAVCQTEEEDVPVAPPPLPTVHNPSLLLDLMTELKTLRQDLAKVSNPPINQLHNGIGEEASSKRRPVVQVEDDSSPLKKMKKAGAVGAPPEVVVSEIVTSDNKIGTSLSTNGTYSKELEEMLDDFVDDGI